MLHFDVKPTIDFFYIEFCFSHSVQFLHQKSQ